MKDVISYRSGNLSIVALSAVILATVGSVTAHTALSRQPARPSNSASTTEADSQIEIRDSTGVLQPLLHSLRESWHSGGGTVVSHDGLSVAFSIQTQPSIDAQHPTIEKPQEWGFQDGTPNFRRGNRLMLRRIPPGGRSEDDARPTLVSPAESWNPSWSPDDRNVAYLSNESGKVQLWVYDFLEAHRRRVSDLQVNAQMVSNRDLPCWSADGKRIYVAVATSFVHEGARPRANPYFRPGEAADARDVSIQDGNPDVATSAIAEIDLENGHYSLLPTNGPINLLHALSISPSGRWLATLTDDFQLSVIFLPEKRLYVVGPVDALPYRADEYAGPYWSPKGDALTYLSGGEIFLLNLQDGFSRARKLATNLPALPWHYDRSELIYADNLNPPAYTRDGQYLVGLILLNNVVQLAVIPMDGSIAKLIPMRGGRVIQRESKEDIVVPLLDGIDLLRVRPNLLWQPLKTHIFIMYTAYDSGENVVDDVDIRTGAVHTVWQSHAQFQIVGQSSNDEVIVLYEDLKTPGNLYRLSSHLKRSQDPLIDLTIPDVFLAPIQSASLAIVSTTVPTRLGALRNLTAAVILPTKMPHRLSPAVVAIYPGSESFWQANRFPDGGSDVPISALLARGYAVVLPHVLGMSPYEPTIEQVETYGVVDSLLPQLYGAHSMGLVDIRRLAVMGYSQGGHAAIAAVSATHLFRAAISVNGVRFAPIATTLWFPTDAHKNVDVVRFAAGLTRLFEDAPYFRVDKVVTPVLLLHGASDPNCSSSELMADALQTAGKEVKFVSYPNLGHDYELWPANDRTDMTNRVLVFLDEHLN